MNSSDALEVFREEMNDEATPYLWSDSLVFRYLDQAQKNFCRWTEGIEDSTTTAITQATVTAGVDWVERWNGRRLARALRRRLAAIRPELGKSPSCSSACSSCGGCAPKSAADAGAGKPVQIVQIVRQR